MAQSLHLVVDMAPHLSKTSWSLCNFAPRHSGILPYPCVCLPGETSESWDDKGGFNPGLQVRFALKRRLDFWFQLAQTCPLCKNVDALTGSSHLYELRKLFQQTLLQGRLVKLEGKQRKIGQLQERLGVVGHSSFAQAAQDKFIEVHIFFPLSKCTVFSPSPSVCLQQKS